MTYKAGKSGSMIIDLRDFLNCTSFESITRARRKIQELHPELRSPSSKVNKYRKERQLTKGTFVFREDTGQGKFV